jgi:hypothetical protein
LYLHHLWIRLAPSSIGIHFTTQQLAIKLAFSHSFYFKLIFSTTKKNSNFITNQIKRRRLVASRYSWWAGNARFNTSLSAFGGVGSSSRQVILHDRFNSVIPYLSGLALSFIELKLILFKSINSLEMHVITPGITHIIPIWFIRNKSYKSYIRAILSKIIGCGFYRPHRIFLQHNTAKLIAFTIHHVGYSGDLQQNCAILHLDMALDLIDNHIAASSR